MRCIVKAFRRTPTGPMDDRNGGLPRLLDSVTHASRCHTSLQHTLLAENLGKPSLRVIITDPWYYSKACLSASAESGTRVIFFSFNFFVHAIRRAMVAG